MIAMVADVGNLEFRVAQYFAFHSEVPLVAVLGFPVDIRRVGCHADTYGWECRRQGVDGSAIAKAYVRVEWRIEQKLADGLAQVGSAVECPKAPADGPFACTGGVKSKSEPRRNRVVTAVAQGSANVNPPQVRGPSGNPA